MTIIISDKGDELQEVVFATCDYCEKTSVDKCQICGCDICSKHFTARQKICPACRTKEGNKSC